MKLLASVVGLATLLTAVMSQPTAEDPWTVIIGGDTQGYLSPCGCVKPMSGGIERRFSLTKSLQSSERTLILENGGLAKGVGRQSELKIEALAETLKSGGVDAINLSQQDLNLDPGIIASAQRLSGNKIVSAADPNIPGMVIPSSFSKGPFSVTALNGKEPNRELFALASFLDEAKANKKIAIVMLAGNIERAKKIVDEFSEIRLVIYQLPGNPPQEPTKYKNSILASPGEKGKHVLRLIWNGNTFEAFEVFALGPDVPDDQKTSEIYDRYLQRVRDEKLIDFVPRPSEAQFAGSQSCQPCHPIEYDIWKKSDHASALQTLEKTNHDRDPECVGCHVVGLDSIKGFKDRMTTPNLANVGCESCHGPAILHTMNPAKNSLHKADMTSCSPCHNLEHSPGFTYESKWPKIRH